MHVIKSVTPTGAQPTRYPGNEPFNYNLISTEPKSNIKKI